MDLDYENAGDVRRLSRWTKSRFLAISGRDGRQVRVPLTRDQFESILRADRFYLTNNKGHVTIHVDTPAEPSQSGGR